MRRTSRAASTTPRRRCLIAVLAFLPCLLSAQAAAGPAAATTAAASLLVPDPFLATLSGKQEPLPLPTLVDAALVVSGVAAAELPSRRTALLALVEETGRLAAEEAKAAGKGGEASLAEAALVTLHDRGALGRYSSEATTMVDILDRHAFNCVSSALLYLLVLRELGLPCLGVQTSDHAFCLVRVEGRDIDVETTNRYGFDPGTKKEFTDAFGRATGYSYVPPGAYAKRRTIGEKELLSLVLSNRSALLEDRRRYAEALALGSSYAALRGDAEGRRFLLDRINNVAAEYAKARKWTALRDLVAAARGDLGEDPRLLTLAGEAADAALSEAIATKPFAEALALVAASAASGDIPATRAKEYYVFLYGSEANRLGRSGDWLAAAALADAGAAATGADRSLVAAAANFRRNFAVDVHNRFVGLYNARRYAEAKTAIEEGLARLPGNAILTADLKAATAALGGR
jgi:hypothetical protein